MIASIILVLYLLGYIPAESAGMFLYMTGILLLVGELFVTTFGVMALNALIALYVGYILQSGEPLILGMPLDWPFVFGIAFVELAIIVVSVIVILRFRRKKVTTGLEAMIGQQAIVREWKGTKGKVFIEGEIWSAESDAPVEVAKEDKVTIVKVKGLTVTITP